MSTQIIPSILVQSKKEFEFQIKAVQNYVNMVQIDIADGKFVPNTTWRDPNITKELLNIDCELHLMVADPLDEIYQWNHVDQVKKVLFHIKSVGVSSVQKIINGLLPFEWEIGLVLDPDIEIDIIDRFISEIDAVMFMGVYPGFQKQEYIPETTERIKNLKQKYPTLFISLDGGVNLKTIPEIITSGVDAICPGSAIFGNDQTPKKNIMCIKKFIHNTM